MQRQAPNSSSSLVLAVQSPTALATVTGSLYTSPRGGFAHGHLPYAVPAAAAPAAALSPGTLGLAAAAAAGPRSPSPSRTWSGGSSAQWTRALSLVALMAMSVRTLFVNQPRPLLVGRVSPVSS
jgi:hypothetical protein